MNEPVELDFCGQMIALHQLELIMMTIQANPERPVLIKNANGVLSLIELGAYLNSISK